MIPSCKLLGLSVILHQVNNAWSTPSSKSHSPRGTHPGLGDPPTIPAEKKKEQRRAPTRPRPGKAVSPEACWAVQKGTDVGMIASGFCCAVQSRSVRVIVLPHDLQSNMDLALIYFLYSTTCTEYVSAGISVLISYQVRSIVPQISAKPLYERLTNRMLRGCGSNRPEDVHCDALKQQLGRL